MLQIRLSPTGRKKRISYRIVVAEKRSKQTGKAIDNLGYYNPNVTPKELKVDKERIAYWQEKGAQLSDGVRKLLNI